MQLAFVLRNTACQAGFLCLSLPALSVAVGGVPLRRCCHHCENRARAAPAILRCHSCFAHAPLSVLPLWHAWPHWCISVTGGCWGPCVVDVGVAPRIYLSLPSRCSLKLVAVLLLGLWSAVCCFLVCRALPGVAGRCGPSLRASFRHCWSTLMLILLRYSAVVCTAASSSTTASLCTSTFDRISTRRHAFSHGLQYSPQPARSPDKTFNQTLTFSACKS